jgi:hypothetical protein
MMLFALLGADIPVDEQRRGALVRLIDRELLLSGAALLVVAGDDDPDESRAVRALVSRLRAPVLVARRTPLAGLVGDVTVDVEPLGADDQRSLWRTWAGPHLPSEDRGLDAVVGHFRLGATAIRAAAEVLGADGVAPAEATDRLWDICRRQGRARVPDLAERIDTGADWDDLVLPDAQKLMLAQMIAHLAHRTEVHERWGFAAKSRRGLGLSALFYGDSGTGKTLAAEVVAEKARLDLWRVDLSRVLDKYIGETEKNLRRIFDAAEESGAILLFDEADALFNKRTEVKDSVDRFANVEVAYLLQRMEAYGGLSILTTNLHRSLDIAFRRRIRFYVEFPFPRAAQRALIWRRSLPAAAPTSGLDFDRLAQLNLPGGNIRNIALNAAFLAAAEPAPIGMRHLLEAARGECLKLERPLSDSEIAGWI